MWSNCNYEGEDGNNSDSQPTGYIADTEDSFKELTIHDMYRQICGYHVFSDLSSLTEIFEEAFISLVTFYKPFISKIY